MTAVKLGQSAPNFKLKDTYGKEHSLKDYKGKKIILYFYPKDSTTGCTIEACEFRDGYKLFEDRGAVILGVSMDDEKSHKKFVDKHNLPFILLADVNGEVCGKYGVYGEKSFMGKKYMGIYRTTFLIDEKGKILRIFENVRPAGHAKEILNLL
jgi:peroxiredoxin Q/BCP